MQIILDSHATSLPTQDALQEPIAIIGMGCRWPGESTQPSELWDFLEAKKDSYSDFPPDRINVDAFYHEKRDRPGSFYTRGGCFLKSPREFDHTFFSINPQEALSLDPAQRKLLETVYEAFESAGVPLEKLSGSRTGCFVGNFNYDHQLMQYRDAEFPEPYAVTGGGLTILSNRINYVFNLQGPSLTLDTACSSSMYALHAACLSIQAGDCSGAIVAGSNLILTPECQIFSSALGAVSPTSRCHTFDEKADGYARAEGIGALYIKRLKEAIRDHDPIRAVIRGTAVNANGKTGGMTRPSSEGQEIVIRRAYERAGGIDYASVGYFELHGTGTPVGDPLEVSAISRVFADSRSTTNPLLIGAIKTNIGHSEPVSGIAGVMKVVLALEHGVLPPTIGLENLNPQIDLREGRMRIVTESTPWPISTSRIASVNSFGYGGANAHTIVEAADSFLYNLTCQKGIPKYLVPASPSRSDHHTQACGYNTHNCISKDPLGNQMKSEGSALSEDHFLLTFSAHNRRTLRSNMAAIRDVSEKYNLVDLAYTLNSRRSSFLERSFIVVTEGTIKKKMSPEGLHIHRKSSKPPTLGFVFTGQGAQWPRMGLDLMDRFPVYLETIRTLDSFLLALESPPSWRIEDVIRETMDTRGINRAQVSQTATAATQIALVNLLSSWQITPAVNMGHSSGEIAATYAAGLITARDAIVIAYLRGQVAGQNQKKGSMLAIGIGEEQLRTEVECDSENIVVACHNSPTSITLSGSSDDILALKATLDAKKIFARILATDGNAYHSPHMKALGAIYEKDIQARLGTRETTSQYSTKPFISSVTGRLCPSEALGPHYWRSNLESPVLFRQALEELVSTIPIDIIVEIGPHGALRGPIHQIAQSLPDLQFPEYLPTLTRGENGACGILNTTGHLYTRGYPVDLQQVNALGASEVNAEASTAEWNGSVIVDLPRYQWQYEKSMILENRWTREWRLRKHPRHDILGSRIPGSAKNRSSWRNVLRLKDLSWLGDHRLGAEIVFPAAGHLLMAIEAATQQVEEGASCLDKVKSYELDDVTLLTALVVPEDERGVEIILTLCPVHLNNSSNYENQYTFVISSIAKSEDSEQSLDHSRGRISVFINDRAPSSNYFALSRATNTKQHVSTSRWYGKFSKVGLTYGPEFQRLSSIVAHGNSNITEAKVDLRNSVQGESRYAIHPAALDSALQLCLIASHSGNAATFSKRYVPVALDHITIWPTCEDDLKMPAVSISKGEPHGIRGLSSSLIMATASGRPLVDAKDLLCLASQQIDTGPLESIEPYSRIEWIPDIDLLTTETAVALHPPMVLHDTNIMSSLDRLALHQLVQFHAKSPDIFKTGSKVPHLQRFLEWAKKQIELALEKEDPECKTIFDYTISRRDDEILRLSSSLHEISSESRMLCHIYRHLSAIFSGEKTGIQVALEDDRLNEMYREAQRVSEGNRRLAVIVNLLAQKNPRLQILEIGAGTGSATREILQTLKGDTMHRTYKQYTFTDITPSFLSAAEKNFKQFHGVTYSTFDMEKPISACGMEAAYDLVVASNAVHASTNILQTLHNLRAVMKVGAKLMLLEITDAPLAAGLLLGTFSDFWKGDLDKDFPRRNGPFLTKSMWKAAFPQAGFSGLDFSLDDYAEHPSATVLVATAVEFNALYLELPVPVIEGLTIVYRSAPNKFVSAFGDYITSQAVPVDLVSLSAPKQLNFRRLIVLAELDAPLFDSVTTAEWEGVRSLMEGAHSILWVTNGALLSGGDPRFAMISGIARGLRTETNAIRLSVLDFDQEVPNSSVDIYESILNLERKISTSSDEHYDIEFRQKNRITYFSRLRADERLNKQWTANAESQLSTESVQLGKLAGTPLRLDIDQPGILSTLYFSEDPEINCSILDNSIQIQVKAAGVNHKNIAALTGKQNSTYCHECAGIITDIGNSVQSLAVGDAVFCPVFARYGSYVTAKAAFCQRIEEVDSFEDMAAMPIAYCTAIYGLLNLAQLGKGETVLIQSATGDVGFAALNIAKLCDAEIYATVETSQKKQELLGWGFGISEDHIFLSSESLTARMILEHTGSKGIDVILSGLPGESMHEYWRCIASFGRFVEIGRDEVLKNGDLSLKIFRRNATFTSFDLELMSNQKPEILSGLMATVKDLHHRRMIKPIPSRSFHISEIERGLQFSSDSTNKVVLTYDDPEASIKFRKSPYRTQLDPNATYLLVGCLGGLGQVFSNWMVQRGAKNLTYLSRSGDAKQETQEFLAELRKQGVSFTVIKGDVACFKDVERAVASCGRPIKGVVQAALTLQDRLFANLSLEMFNTVITPRVLGTVNLHRALEHCPLDFFLMWSSWTAIFGTATQSSYLASCAFMDAFARYRCGLGLPATSLNLNQIFDTGMVGRKEAYTTAMTRNGLYGNDQQEFLHYCDAAISSSGDFTSAYDPLATAQLLAGIEPTGLRRTDKTHPLREMPWYRDLRFSSLTKATETLPTESSGSEAKADTEDSQATPLDRIHRKLAQLLYVSMDDIDVKRPIRAYGIDSMIAAELRNWLYASLSKDVSLFTMLSSDMTVEKLAQSIGQKE